MEHIQLDDLLPSALSIQRNAMDDMNLETENIGSVVAHHTQSAPLLEEHNIQCYTGKKPFACDQCAKTFSYDVGLQNHVHCHTVLMSDTDGEKQHICKQCDKCFVSAGLLSIHVLSHDKCNYQCDVCSKQFNTSGKLSAHLEQHGDRKQYQCDKCGKCFKNPIRQHSSCYMVKQRCEVCGKMVATLSAHLLSHSDHRPHQCKQCGKFYKSIHALRNHTMTHSTENHFACTQCDRRFPRKDYLRSHLLNVHSDLRRFKCEKCDGHFKQKEHLKTHAMTCGIEPSIVARPHACNICAKRFVHLYVLNKHMKSVHSDERPFRCDICEMGFKMQHQLKGHKVICAARTPGSRKFSAFLP